MKNRDHVTGPSRTTTWLTPLDLLTMLGVFDLDPCAAPDPKPWPTAINHYTLPQDGLTLPWYGRVWINPPYGRSMFKWLGKLADHGSGIALIFARTETIGFHSEIWDRAHSVLFLKGRVYFYLPDGTKGGRPNAPSCLISYSVCDTAILTHANAHGLAGKLVTLDNR